MRAALVVAGLLATAGCERGWLIVPERALSLDAAALRQSGVTAAALPIAAPVLELPQAPGDAGQARDDGAVTTFDAASLPDPATGPPCEPGDELPMTVSARSDHGFREQYRAALETGRLADGATLTLHFCGDVRPIVALGFTLFSVDLERGWAAGGAKYLAAERLVQHPGVRWLAVGEENQTVGDLRD
ncbi:MAG: hypothetical protein INH41_13410 [Myxococcaceae bacterium]|jgi:hypothetical protein|nr:hypothetical protein [Myxococcaceae bacterium]